MLEEKCQNNVRTKLEQCQNKVRTKLEQCQSNDKESMLKDYNFLDFFERTKDNIRNSNENILKS